MPDVFPRRGEIWLINFNPARGSKQKGISISGVLENVQQNLFIIQASIAGADKKISKDKVEYLEESYVVSDEKY